MCRNSTPTVSPVKVTLTPAKEEAEEEDVEVELEEDEVTLVDSAEAKAVGRKRNPSLWVQELLLTEQVEEEEEDGEYLPPPTCLDIDLDYDEVCSSSFHNGSPCKCARPYGGPYKTRLPEYIQYCLQSTTDWIHW